MGGVSWTLGQVDFTNDPAGHVQQGVQQPYTDIGTAVEEPSGAPAFVLAPNPASGDAVLATTSTASGTWTWTLADAGGRTVLDGPLYGSTTTIPATALAQGAYQLTVLRDGTPHTTLTLLKR